MRAVSSAVIGLAVLIVAHGGAFASTAASAGDQEELVITPGSAHDGFTFEIEVTSRTSGESPGSSTTSSDASAVPVVQDATQETTTDPGPRYIVLMQGPDGPCLGWSTDPGTASTLTGTVRLVEIYDVCPPAEEGEAVPPEVIAEIEVLRFWATKPVPRMELEIDPGWAITGLRAYLETGPDSATAQTLTFDTPVGQAVADITADYIIDWGDDTSVEQYSVNGGAWPNGDISHVYQWAQPVTVTATQHWTGTWRMTSGPAAGVGGQLPQLPMTATLDLLVDEVQAVIQ